jgi:hypothetical protein
MWWDDVKRCGFVNSVGNDLSFGHWN